jgi:hypothetical protein
MIIRFTFKTKTFIAGASDCCYVKIVDFYTVIAIYSGAELVVTVDLGE